MSTKNKIEETKREGLHIKCSNCRKKLTSPGAVLFSPPFIVMDTVIKYHLCRECWMKIAKFLIGEAND